MGFAAIGAAGLFQLSAGQIAAPPLSVPPFAIPVPQSSMLTLTGANTYTGTTTISVGTLSIGNGGTTGSVTGNVAEGRVEQRRPTSGAPRGGDS